MIWTPYTTEPIISMSYNESISELEGTTPKNKENTQITHFLVLDTLWKRIKL